jgi:hypothetical protein
VAALGLTSNDAVVAARFVIAPVASSKLAVIVMLLYASSEKDVDARDKPAHDVERADQNNRNGL